MSAASSTSVWYERNTRRHSPLIVEDITNLVSIPAFSGQRCPIHNINPPYYKSPVVHGVVVLILLGVLLFFVSALPAAPSAGACCNRWQSLQTPGAVGCQGSLCASQPRSHVMWDQSGRLPHPKTGPHSCYLYWKMQRR